jgi:hypothetical protein
MGEKKKPPTVVNLGKGFPSLDPCWTPYPVTLRTKLSKGWGVKTGGESGAQVDTTLRITLLPSQWLKKKKKQQWTNQPFKKAL